MPPIQDDDEIERDDEDLDQSTRELMAKFLDEAEAAQGDDPEDERPPLEDPENNFVGIDDGLDLVEKARQQRDAAGRFKAKAESDAAPQEEAPQPQEEAATEAPPAADAAPVPISALLEGLPEDRKAAIQTQITQAEDLFGALKPYGDALKSYGDTPKAQVARMAQISAYAAANPIDYIAWAADTLSQGNAAEALSKVAERIGMRLAPIEGPDEEDPFEDPETKALREEVKRLRAQVQPRPAIGPDSPEWQAQRQEVEVVSTVASWKDEKGADGKPLRPLFDLLAPQIAQRMKAIPETQGRVATMDDLAAIYGELHAQVAQQGGFAAQSAPVVAQPMKAQAAPSSSAMQRAKAASKSIGGTGQGAPSRAATPDNQSLSAFLSSKLSEMGFED